MFSQGMTKPTWVRNCGIYFSPTYRPFLGSRMLEHVLHAAGTTNAREPGAIPSSERRAGVEAITAHPQSEGPHHLTQGPRGTWIPQTLKSKLKEYDGTPHLYLIWLWPSLWSRTVSSRIQMEGAFRRNVPSGLGKKWIMSDNVPCSPRKKQLNICSKHCPPDPTRLLLLNGITYALTSVHGHLKREKTDWQPVCSEKGAGPTNGMVPGMSSCADLSDWHSQVGEERPTGFISTLSMNWPPGRGHRPNQRPRLHRWSQVSAALYIHER